MIDPEHIQWCRAMFGRLNQRGIWTVPRSGLIFQKQGDAFVLIMAMDPAEVVDAEMAKQVAAYQTLDYALTRQHFAAADIEIKCSENLTERFEAGRL